MSWTDDSQPSSGSDFYSRLDRGGQSTFINPALRGGRSNVLPQYQQDVPAPTPAPPSSPPALPPAPEPIDPKELAAVLFGQNIPIAIGSSLQVGGRIIEGPQYLTLDGASSVNAVSFIAGYYIPINYNTAGRTVTELWFRGQKAWTEDDGSLMPPTAPVLTVGGATTGTEQRVRFTTGTLDQAADAWSIGRHGAANAIAYRPMVTGIFQNIRIEQFGNLIPFTSVTVTDSEWGDPGDLVPWSSLIEYLAQMDMRWSNLYGIREFDTVDVTGGVESLILGSPMYFTEFLAGMRKIKPYWHLRTEDRLWVIEKGPYSLDLTLEMSKVQARGGDPVTIHMADAKENNQEVLVSYLDRDRDYERTTVRAAMEINPIQTTDAFKSETINVPVVSTMDEMIVAANLALFSQDMEREQSEFTGLAPYLGMQPGDTMAIPTDERTYFHAAFEIVRKPDLTTEVKARGFLTCAAEASPGEGFIAVGGNHRNIVSDDDDTVVSSSGDGETWSEETSGLEAWFYAIATNDSVYVAVGGDLTDITPATQEPKIATSATGSGWTPRTPPIITEGVLNDVCWSGSQFVTVGIDYNNGPIVGSPQFGLVGTSADGITWTQRTLSADEYHLFGVTFGNSLYVAVGQDRDVNFDCAIFTSSDAITWTKRTASIAGVESWLNDVAWTGALFVAVGYNADTGEAIIMTSPDGTTWTTRTHPASPSGVLLNGIYCADGLCVAVGETFSGLTPAIFTSTDAITWTSRTPSPSSGIALESVTKSGDLWCAVGGVGFTPSIMTSVDGAAWIEQTPDPETAAYFRDVIAAHAP